MGLQVLMDNLEDAPLEEMGDKVDYNYSNKDEKHSTGASPEGSLSEIKSKTEDIGAKRIVPKTKHSNQDEVMTESMPPPIIEEVREEDNTRDEATTSNVRPIINDTEPNIGVSEPSAQPVQRAGQMA